MQFLAPFGNRSQNLLNLKKPQFFLFTAACQQYGLAAERHQQAFQVFSAENLLKPHFEAADMGILFPYKIYRIYFIFLFYYGYHFRLLYFSYCPAIPSMSSTLPT